MRNIIVSHIYESGQLADAKERGQLKGRRKTGTPWLAARPLRDSHIPPWTWSALELLPMLVCVLQAGSVGKKVKPNQMTRLPLASPLSCYVICALQALVSFSYEKNRATDLFT